ncbi:MAG: efflux RND transporter permease subunit [Marinomonas sp.]
MNPSRLFIERPVATLLLMFSILLSGALTYSLLPVSALPEVDYPTIQITTLYPGASPDVMATAVTAPLEQELGEMSGLNQMYSTSSGGASIITLKFDLSLALDVAEQEVQAAINTASSFLPSDLPNSPSYKKVNPADGAVLTIAASSDILPLTTIQDLINSRVALKLAQISGVGLVTLAGGHQPAIRIKANSRALAAHNLTLEDIYTLINNSNVNTSKGGFDGKYHSITIDANDQLATADQYAQLILKYENNAPLRLKDVATVVSGSENTYLSATANGKPAIIIQVKRQPGANVIDVVDNIEAKLPQLRTLLPNSIKLTVLSDRTQTIRSSISDVKFELMLSIALVIMVTFLFLRNLAATLIPSIAVPLSLIGTFVVMYLAGFSINNLSLMALTIATGFVIDDAIVVVENISRHIEQGKSPLQAALKGSKQIAFTVISLTFSLIAVLIPLLFMGDVVGRLFREFAITLSVSILVSMVISLTLTPMLCAYLLRYIPEEEQSRFYKKGGQVFDRIIALYDRSLTKVLNHQNIALIAIFGLLLVTIGLYIIVPKGFFPTQDTGTIRGITVASDNVSFKEMTKRQQAVVTRLLEDKDINSITATIGVDGQNISLNRGRLQINLKDFDDRTDRAPAIIKRLRDRVADIPGIQLYLQAQQDLTVDDQITPSQYQFTLDDTNSTQLAKWTPTLLKALQNKPELQHVISNLEDQGLVSYVTIHRDIAARYGITAADIDTALYNAFGQRLISTIYTQSNQYRVVLEVPPSTLQATDTFDQIYLSGTASSDSENPPMVHLTEVATITQKTGALMKARLGQIAAVTVSFDIAEGYSLEQAQQVIRDTMATLNIPTSLTMKYQGSASAFEDSTGNTLWLIVAALLTMYVVLGILYESFIHPLTILSTLPTAAIGAFIALLLRDTDFNLIALIGVILLIGIVKKNAIMMIDFALEAEKEQHLAPREAIHQACLLRLRPILMTTMAALFGALPLMLAQGSGAELRQPMGLVIVGGLILSQLLTLFSTPVIYLLFDKLIYHRRRLKKQNKTRSV